MAKISLTFKEYKEIKNENNFKEEFKKKENEILHLKLEIAKQLNNGNKVKQKKLKNYETKPEFIEIFNEKITKINEKYENIAKGNYSKEEYQNTIKILEDEFKDFDKINKKLLYAFISDNDEVKEKYLSDIITPDYVKRFFIKNHKNFYVPLLKNIKDEITDYFLNELDTSYIQKTERYFSKERLVNTYEKLTADNFEKFISVYFNFFDEINLELFYDDFDIENEFYDYFFQHEEIVCFLQENENFCEIFDNSIRDVIVDAICDAGMHFDLFSEINGYFTPNRVKKLILKNKNYDFIKKQIKESERRERKIENALNEMPESFFDYFPLARTKKRKFTLHIGPTNSGKTYMSLQEFKNFKNGIYLGPLRLLAFEQYEKLNNKGIKCNLVTGEELITVENANFESATIEMLDINKEYDIVVIDEGQMIEDTSRGGAWSRAIVGANSNNIHICAAPESFNILTEIIEKCGDTYTVIKHERQTPLIIEDTPVNLNNPQKGDAYIVFSRKNVHSVAGFFTSKGFKCSIIYGALPYQVRHEEARKFNSGETDILVSTDAIGMGLNLPIKRVIFLESEKFDGKQVRSLYGSEIRQIGGRAGRRGIFEKGYINFYDNRKALKKKYEKVETIIERPKINFPEELIKIDAPLSLTIKKWALNDNDKTFVKNIGEREIFLAQYLEKHTSIKKIIYDLITIPFNEKDETLLDVWQEIADSEITDCEEDSTISSFIEDDISEITNSYELERAEKNYAILDILYQYRRKFGYINKLKEISDTKEKIAMQIIDYLKRSKFKNKTCRDCGKILPWNHKFPMCDDCYQEMRRMRAMSRGYYYDDYEDDF